MSEDTATKLKQLSDNLQAAQSKISKKKEEIEQKNKSIKDLERELQDLTRKVQYLGAQKLAQNAMIDDIKKSTKKQIEDVKRVVDADKTALAKEKEELEEKLVKLQAEAKKIESEKQSLLKGHKFETPKEETKKEETKNEEEEETLESLSKGFKIRKDANGFLDVETVTKIIDICTALAGRQFRDQVAENRKSLRAKGVLSLAEYLDQAGKELSQHTQIYQEIENQTLKSLGVEKSLLDKSIEYYYSQGNFQILALMNMLGEKLKSYLRGTKTVDKETFKKILETKIEFIEKEAEGIFSEENKKIVNEKSFAGVAAEGAQKEQMALMVLKNYFEFRLGYEIFNKFGVEEEDIREASQNPDIQYDVEIAELLVKVEQTFYSKIPKPTAQPQEGQPQGEGQPVTQEGSQ